MNPTVAIHTAARQYCIDRATYWHQRYAELTARDRHQLARPDGTWSYTQEACDIFLRYQTLAAIQSEVERFVPSDFASLEDASQTLELAGETAQSEFTKFTNPMMQAAAEVYL